ncbi:MAG: protein tyrosine kinase [Piscirickettsiaceae bacterium]|nr:MAG: protein tyrosine kinase [Piscirickettsiaceae bacterium]PCI70159.1 MAG: protein tyrosine kinase [Piscirickettsiaceae bacterium]
MDIIQKAAKKIAGAKPSLKPLLGETHLKGSFKEKANKHVVPRHEEAAVSKRIKLPLQMLQQEGYLTPDGLTSRLSDEYRTIKRPLLDNIFGKKAKQVNNVNLIMVTSSVAGEGKTYTALNLAMSIAMEQDKSVMLVDADTVKASATKLLGVESSTLGLTTLLDKPETAFSEVMLRTDIENLTFLPAGEPHERSNELFASSIMADLLKELSQRYADRIIIFDSPPLLQTTEASVLASRVGQVVFVVAAESTLEGAVVEAIHQLGDDKIIGCVLNKYKKKLGDSSSYAYGYGYGYGVTDTK